jgi:hypothetical protein
VLSVSAGWEPRQRAGVGVAAAVRLGRRHVLERGDRDLHPGQPDHGGLSRAVRVERCRGGAASCLRERWVLRRVLHEERVDQLHGLPCRYWSRYRDKRISLA